MPHVLLEATFEPPLTEEELDRQFERITPCIEQNDVRWICSFLSKDRRRRVCLHEAADAEAVRMAYRTANVPFIRVWSAELLALEEEPSLFQR